MRGCHLLPCIAQVEGWCCKNDKNGWQGLAHYGRWWWKQWCINDQWGTRWRWTVRERGTSCRISVRFCNSRIPETLALDIHPRQVSLWKHIFIHFVLLLQECGIDDAALLLRLLLRFQCHDSIRRMVHPTVQYHLHQSARHTARRARLGHSPGYRRSWI